jgi:hypothetical protein
MGFRGDEKHLVQVEGDAHGLPRLPGTILFHDCAFSFAGIRISGVQTGL